MPVVCVQIYYLSQHAATFGFLLNKMLSRHKIQSSKFWNCLLVLNILFLNQVFMFSVIKTRHGTTLELWPNEVISKLVEKLNRFFFQSGIYYILQLEVKWKIVPVTWREHSSENAEEDNTGFNLALVSQWNLCVFPALSSVTYGGHLP